MTTFTARDVQIWQASACHYRDRLQKHSDCKKAARIMQRHITDNNLLIEKCQRKGVFEMPESLSPRNQLTAGRITLCLAVLFLAGFVAKAWMPDPDMSETIAQERYAAENFNPVPDGADYYPPNEQ